MTVSVKENASIIKIFSLLKNITRSDIARGLEKPVSSTQVFRVMYGMDKSPRVQAAIIEALGLPEDFFSSNYVMTIELKKIEIESEAA